MIAIPAIDLRDGACVQLVGGDFAKERVRRDDPLSVAREWHRAGFSRLHLVDLDAALGRATNRATVRSILDERTMIVQLGGGLRDESSVEDALRDGARYAVVGTRALDDPDWLDDMCEQHPHEIVLAIDVRERRVVTHGWERTTQRTALEVLEDVSELPLAAVMVTAVHREGQMQGVDLTLIEDAVAVAHCPVLAAGGVRGMRDLHELEERGAAGVVVGMALYTGALDPRHLAMEYGE